MHEGRRHQLDGLTRQLEIVGCKRGGGDDKGGDGGAQQCGTAGDHDTLLVGVCILNFVPPFCARCGKLSLLQRKLLERMTNSRRCLRPDNEACGRCV